ncbi:MAG TPA: hypothetical protein VM734_29745 [Kofleriaceae bacterium]|nr:hypothetical protein [Kofleriaceae bacterium]
MRRIRLLAPLLVAPLAACVLGGADPDDPDDPDDVDSPTDPSVLLVEDPCPGDQAQVAEAQLDGEALVVTAGYGGCTATRLWACWDGLFLTSDPPQAIIAVRHQPAGVCDAYFTQTERISLAPLLDALEDWAPMTTLRIHVGDTTLVWTP